MAASVEEVSMAASTASSATLGSVVASAIEGSMAFEIDSSPALSTAGTVTTADIRTLIPTTLTAVASPIDRHLTQGAEPVN